MEFKLGELFCGPGGLACGAMNADIGLPDFKIVHAWANDYDESTCKTYRRNICPDAPKTVYCKDIRKFVLSNTFNNAVYEMNFEEKGALDLIDMDLDVLGQNGN